MKIDKNLIYKFVVDLPILFFVISRETYKLEAGDASSYQMLFENFIKGEEWPIQAGAEPVWLGFVKIASFFGNNGLIFLMSSLWQRKSLYIVILHLLILLQTCILHESIVFQKM